MGLLSSRAVFLQEALGKNPFISLFQFLEAAYIAWFMATSLQQPLLIS